MTWSVPGMSPPDGRKANVDDELSLPRQDHPLTDARPLSAGAAPVQGRPVDGPHAAALHPAQRAPGAGRRGQGVVVQVIDAREEAARVVALRATEARAVQVVAELVQQRVQQRLGAGDLLADGG